jgi:TPR repeat protein
MLFAGRTFSGDRAFLTLQRQLALRPDRVPDPPLEATSNLLAPIIKGSAAVALAALVAAVLVWLPSARRNANETKQSGDLSIPIAKNVKSAEMQSAPVTPPPFIQTPDVALRGMPNPKPETAPAAGNPLSGPASNSRTSTVTSGPASGTTSTSEGAAELTNDEIATLLSRGKDFFNNGDVVSARLLFRRAAAAGNAEAAFVLGRTFDPVVADQMGIIGIKPGIASARWWYERAAELGSFAASQELTRLQPSSEIATLLSRGKDFFNNGDVVSARLLFRRAAAAGNAEAAFVLGRTFDPVVADQMGIIGIKADIAGARRWYERAAELGSPAASQELARLEPSVVVSPPIYNYAPGYWRRHRYRR